MKSARRVFKLFIIALFILGASLQEARAQLQTLSSHYYLNQLAFNPAAAGADEGVNIFANYRGQWIGLVGAPHTQVLAADMSLPMIGSGAGAGFTFTNDMIGAERHTSIRGNFSYFMDMGKKYKIGIGVAAGLVNTSIDGNKLTTPDGADDFLPQGKQGLVRPDLAVGVLIRGKSLKVGLSYNNMISSANIDGAVSTLETKYGSYFNLFGAYKLSFANRFSLEPSVLVRTDYVNWQTDVGAMFDYRDFIFSGIYFRGYNKFATDAFYATVGLKPIGNFAIFFSYDLGLNALNDVHNGTFEISIKAFVPESKLFKRGKIIHNPRYL